MAGKWRLSRDGGSSRETRWWKSVLQRNAVQRNLGILPDASRDDVLSLSHKHLFELEKKSGLSVAPERLPVCSPSVSLDFRLISSVSFDVRLISYISLDLRLECDGLPSSLQVCPLEQ